MNPLALIIIIGVVYSIVTRGKSKAKKAAPDQAQNPAAQPTLQKRVSSPAASTERMRQQAWPISASSAPGMPGVPPMPPIAPRPEVMQPVVKEDEIHPHASPAEAIEMPAEYLSEGCEEHYGQRPEWTEAPKGVVFPMQRSALMQAFIASEVFGKPKALRRQ